MPELTRPPLRPARRWRIRRPLPYWAVATAVALATAALVGHLAAGLADARARWSPGLTVLVAKHAVAPGGAVEAEARQLPAAAVPDDALRSLPSGATAVVALHAGEVLLRDRVGGRSALAAALPPGTRGIAVPNDTALPLRRGDHVDVLATFDADVAGYEPTFPVARDALVLHVGRDAVTIAVRDASAPKVAYALAAGAVTLALSGTSSRR